MIDTLTKPSWVEFNETQTAGGFASGSALRGLSKISLKGAASSGLASGLIASPLSVGGNAIPSGK